MLCQLCNRNKAFVIVRIGKARFKVCTFCAIVEKLEVLEAINVWEMQQEEKSMEEADKD